MSMILLFVAIPILHVFAATKHLHHTSSSTSPLDIDLEASNVQIPTCLNSSYYSKYGWASYSTFTGLKRQIILEIEWWDSAILSSQIFFHLLTEVMGYSVNVRVYDGGPTTGPRLANGTSSDVALELWPSDASTWYEKYVQLENSIVDYGSVGYTGRVGLYFPSYMLDEYSQYDTLDFWKMLVHPETQRLFPRSGSGPHATHSDGSPVCDGNPFGCVNGTYKPSWYTDSEKQNFVEIWMQTMETTVYYFQRLVDGLRLNATLNFLGNDAFSNLVSAYEAKKPFLAYQWRPTTTLAGLNLTRIIFPDDSIGAFKRFQKDPVHTSVTVDIPVENLFKASSAKFATDFPELSYYLSKFSIPEQSIDEMLSKIPTTVGDWTDTSYTETTCDWLKTHESLWATWIPPPPVSQSQCPIGTGRYLSNSLYVCLKCLPGTYNLNATTTQECDSCPENASCPGGATVNVNAMFWMPVTPSNITGDYVPEIHLCPHGKQCCPSGNCTSTAICEEGFTGVFCTECADSSLYPWNGKCVTCSSAGGSFYLTVILPAFFTAAVIFVPKYHAAEFEQIFFYFQVINLIFDDDIGAVIGWDGLNKILAVFSLDIDSLVFDCPLPLRGQGKALFRFLLPVVILFYFTCYYSLLKFFPKVHQALPQYMAEQNVDVLFARSFTIVFSFVLMPLVEAALVLLNCDEVLGENVLFHVPNVHCYSHQHTGPVTVAFVTLGLLLAVYPFGLLITLMRLHNEKRIAKEEHHDFKENPMDQVYEAFYMPYRPQFFYMESVVIWERGVIVLVFTFLNHNRDSQASIAYLVIFTLYGLTRAYIQPYKKLLQVYLNREIGIGFIIFLALRQYAKFEPEALNITPFIVTVIILPLVNHALRWIFQGYMERNHKKIIHTKRSEADLSVIENTKKGGYSAVPTSLLGTITNLGSKGGSTTNTEPILKSVRAVTEGKEVI